MNSLRFASITHYTGPSWAIVGALQQAQSNDVNAIAASGFREVKIPLGPMPRLEGIVLDGREADQFRRRHGMMTIPSALWGQSDDQAAAMMPEMHETLFNNRLEQAGTSDTSE